LQVINSSNLPIKIIALARVITTWRAKMQRAKLNYTRVSRALITLSAWLLELSKLKIEIEKELEKPKLIRIK
jgi:hypothetical protein